MRMNRCLALALVLAAAFAPLGCSAPVVVTNAPVAVSAAGSAITEGDVRRLLTALADDSLEGRATGSRGSAKAARIIANEMMRIGLEPAGDSGFFQRVPLAVVMQGTRERPVAYSSFAALDTVPASQRRNAVNVIGILRGSDPGLRDSVILVDAHYDHLGISSGAKGDSIFNGADDDASGTVAVIEIARAMAQGQRPRRTVIFAATTGEEVGLIGTRWYLAHPVAPIASMTANLEIEMIGRPDSLAGGPGRGWLTGFDRSTMGTMFAAAGLPIVPDRRLDQSFFTRSDNIAFAQAGVPAHTLSSYNMHDDYHTVADDASRVDFPHMTGVIRAGAAAVRLLADGPAPTWYPGGRPSAPAPRTGRPPTRPVTAPNTPPASIPPTPVSPGAPLDPVHHEPNAR
ncbi:MAG: M20/M25/M40 family metallo-hydrolase [bacterium]